MSSEKVLSMEQDVNKKIWKGQPTIAARLPGCFFVFVLLGIAPFFFDPYIGLMSLGLFFVLFLPSWLVIALYAAVTATYEISSKKVTLTSGLFFKKNVEIERAQIVSVQIKQDFWGKILGYGNVFLIPYGTAGVVIILKNVRHPAKLQGLLQNV